MKRYLIKALAIVIGILPLVQACELQVDPPNENVSSSITHNDATSHRKSPGYIENQLIVIYKHPPTPEHSEKIKNAIQSQTPDAILERRCSDCDSYVELWRGDSIHTTIHADGIVSGTKSNKPVGEDTLAYYSRNFTNHLPFDGTEAPKIFPIGQSEPNSEGKDKIVIAVIDTGVDANGIKEAYQWKIKSAPDKVITGVDANYVQEAYLEVKNKPVIPDNVILRRSCYPADIHGWNFINNNATISDDNINRHGTLVSQYIINQFEDSSSNFVQIMSLKTFDSNGNGNLFQNICAIHFAIQNGANIINASWGFYDYGDEGHPYMKHLITNKLKEKGILFITAAGNKIQEDDDYAVLIEKIDPLKLRNLEYHHFYPAYLSNESSNVITVTTTDGSAISSTQNYSSKHVDLGVVCDKKTPDFMQFRVPFNPYEYISGSSFATAIATGKIGAFFPKSSYSLVPVISKQELMYRLSQINEPSGTPVISYNEGLSSFIRKGRYIEK